MSPVRPMANVDAEALIKRVWSGQRNIEAARMSRLADLEDLQIVVSEEGHAALVLYGREKMPYSTPASWEYPDHAFIPKMRLFGLPVVVDKDLMPAEARFRMEVSV